MSDDLSKKYRDGWTVSFSQPYEVAYFENSIKQEFPSRSIDDIRRAIDKAKGLVAPSEGREKLKECVRKILKGLL
jgi:hypothetical protein